MPKGAGALCWPLLWGMSGHFAPSCGRSQHCRDTGHSGDTAAKNPRGFGSGPCPACDAGAGGSWGRQSPPPRCPSSPHLPAARISSKPAFPPLLQRALAQPGGDRGLSPSLGCREGVQSCPPEPGRAGLVFPQVWARWQDAPSFPCGTPPGRKGGRPSSAPQMEPPQTSPQGHAQVWGRTHAPCDCEVPDVLLGGAGMSTGHSRPSQVPTNPRKAASSPCCSVSTDRASCKETARNRGAGKDLGSRGR